jgi:hypothetical protein
LGRAFGYPDVLCQFLIADLYCAITAFLFGDQPYIDEEADGTAVMADEVTHEDIDNVIITREHNVVRLLEVAVNYPSIAVARARRPRDSRRDAGGTSQLYRQII